jgi:Bacterial Ig-like domain/Bacterial pre-peptidase C-terminal domain
MLRCRRPRGLRRLSIALLAAASLVGVAGATPVAADQTSNIPGTALPGTLTSGLLGGAIYDVVYRVTVPAGHVLLVSMTGDPGTDFDLYLFDSGATSIYAKPPVGLVAKSTGPTSMESITYSSTGGGTYYLDLSGFTNVLGSYRLAVRISADTTRPQVTLSLNGGAPATNEPAVTATVVATDDISGVRAMQFSVDAATWRDSTAYAPTVLWSFDPPDGPKDLWVRVIDGAGNVSVPAHATIALDTLPPTVVWRDPLPDGTAAGVRPIFSVRFSEPIQPSTWAGFGLILQDSAGTIIQGTYTYNPASSTGTFTPAVDLQPGSSYVVSMGSITDLAGNPLVPIGRWVVIPRLAPRIVVHASGTVIPQGELVVFTGRMDPPLAGALTLEAAAGNGPFVPIAPIVSGADGTFTSGVPVSANTWFRVSFGGNEVASYETSPTVRVLVRREVGLRGLRASVTRSTARDRTVPITAVVVPAEPSVAVTLTVYRYNPSMGRYVQVSTMSRSSAGGLAPFSWRPTTAGRYYLRLTTPPTALFANGISAAYRWVVY